MASSSLRHTSFAPHTFRHSIVQTNRKTMIQAVRTASTYNSSPRPASQATTTPSILFPSNTQAPSRTASTTTTSSPPLSSPSTTQQQAQSPPPQTQPTTLTSTPSQPSLSSPPLPSNEVENPPYFIHRTPSLHLPVYQSAKRGGNLHLTTIRKISGDVARLRTDLVRGLGLKDEGVKVNGVNGQVVLKGWMKDEVKRFLTERRF